jgi:integrase
VVVEWLRTLRVLAADKPYVFPRLRHARYRVPHMGIDAMNTALAELEHGLAAFTVHDLRRTARTHLAALGVRREVAERCLACLSQLAPIFASFPG